METTIIIRTKNEEKWIGEVLKRLGEQTYRDFEIIIVDSGSTDKTLAIAQKFPVRILRVPQEKFSYPYALNYGISHASATGCIVILSAHSLPISSLWLADGVSHMKNNSDVAGVYGPLVPLPDATFWDKCFQGALRIRKLFRKPSVRNIKKPGMGVLGFTNAIVKKHLWEQHHFDEAYGAGGEDGEWAGHWLGRGYRIIWDERFAVMHSHYLGLREWKEQYRYWKSLSRPQPFNRLPFRKDGAHRG